MLWSRRRGLGALVSGRCLKMCVGTYLSAAFFFFSPNPSPTPRAIMSSRMMASMISIRLQPPLFAICLLFRNAANFSLSLQTL